MSLKQSISLNWKVHLEGYLAFKYASLPKCLHYSLEGTVII